MLQNVILLITACIIAYLGAENAIAAKNRKKLKHVIYVNGIRGKSTVTRLIDSALRQGGYKTLCKTTGTVPMYIDVNNNEINIKRRGRANIKEQLWEIGRASCRERV